MIPRTNFVTPAFATTTVQVSTGGTSIVVLYVHVTPITPRTISVGEVGAEVLTARMEELDQKVIMVTIEQNFTIKGSGTTVVMDVSFVVTSIYMNVSLEDTI